MSNDFLCVDLADANVELAKLIFLDVQSSHHFIEGQSHNEIKMAVQKKKHGIQRAKELIYTGIEQFTGAYRITKNDHVCLGSWGLALVDLAEIHAYQGEEHLADNYLQQAAQKYEESCSIEPFDFLADWARALYERAKLKEGHDSIDLLNLSTAKLNQSLDMMDSQGHNHLGKASLLKSCGDVYSELSLLIEDTVEADVVHNIATDKYQQSIVESDKDDNGMAERATIYNNWGNCYYDYSKRKQEKWEVRKYLELSVEKYMQGLAVKPEDEAILFNLGDVVVELAKMEEDPVKLDQYFSIARSKYSQSTHDSITLNNWGFAFYENGMMRTDYEGKLSMLSQAEQKFNGDYPLLYISYYTSYYISYIS